MIVENGLNVFLAIASLTGFSGNLFKTTENFYFLTPRRKFPSLTI